MRSVELLSVVGDIMVKSLRLLSMSKICQVREAYRKRGWAFMNSENIAQCKNDDYLGKIKEQEGEACNIYGYLEVNKVRTSYRPS